MRCVLRVACGVDDVTAKGDVFVSKARTHVPYSILCLTDMFYVLLYVLCAVQYCEKIFISMHSMLPGDINGTEVSGYGCYTGGLKNPTPRLLGNIFLFYTHDTV